MTKSTKIIAALGVAAGLGIAALPAGAIFAVTDPIFDYSSDTATSANVTVRLNVGEAIALKVSATDCLGDSDSAEAGVQSFTLSDAGSCTMNVSGGTNAVSGFDLKVAIADGATSYLKLAGSTTQTSQNSIPGQNGSAVAAGTAGWNLTGGALTNFAPTSTATTMLRTQGAKQLTTEVTYNFATGADQESGEYSTQLTYTIAPNTAGLTEATGHIVAEYPEA